MTQDYNSNINWSSWTYHFLSDVQQIVDTKTISRINNNSNEPIFNKIQFKLSELNQYFSNNRNFKFIKSNNLQYLDIMIMTNIYYTQLYLNIFILEEYPYVIKYLENVKNEFSPDVWHTNMHTIYKSISNYL